MTRAVSPFDAAEHARYGGRMPKRSPSPRQDTARFQLKVVLLGSKPPIWRRLIVLADATLGDLHWIVQGAMGWTNSHLHQFYDEDRTYYSDPEFELEDAEDESKVSLSELLREPKDRIIYEYDFGDSWAHQIELEKILPQESAKRQAMCVAGKRAGPPEDCGGVWGYADFLEAIKDPEHESHEDMLEWIGGEFEPEHFDIDEVNRSLKKVLRPKPDVLIAPLPPADPPP
jgi:hypothetical protein